MYEQHGHALLFEYKETAIHRYFYEYSGFITSALKKILFLKQLEAFQQV